MKLKQVKNITFLFLIIALCNYQKVIAQTITVSAKPDSTNYTIGDYINIKLSVTNTKHTPIIWPDLNIDTSSKLELVKASKIDTTENGYLQTISYIHFDSGIYLFPAFKFFISTKNKVDTLNTQPFKVYIKGITVDTVKAIRPIKKPMDIDYTFTEIVPYIILGLIALMIIAAFSLYWFVFRKRKQILNLTKEEIKLSPYELAIKKLTDLESENLILRNEIKLYYTTISDIIREYVQNIYNVTALESTTDELMDKLKYSTMDAASRQQMFELLSSSDLVKFAKATPSTNEHIAAMIAAKNFIEKNKPAEQELENTQS